MSRLIYISVNNGSDTRVSKEIRSLCKQYEVIYLGLGDKVSPFISENIIDYKIFAMGQKNFLTYFFLNAYLIFLRLKYKTSNVYLVDEQLLGFMLPSLIGAKVVLDIFDSIFLKLNKPNEQWFLIKWLLYSFCKLIIVTDSNRMALLPRCATVKAYVLPNVPYVSSQDQENFVLKLSIPKDRIVVGYFGSMAEERGSKFLQELIDLSPDKYHVVSGGWVYDEYSSEFLSSDNVTHVGLLKQSEIIQILNKYCDFLLCIYPTNNLNNINASPNKIYDAIHAQTPCIINRDVLVSSLVHDLDIGCVIPSNIDTESAHKQITSYIEEIRKPVDWDVLARNYCWNNHELSYLERLRSIYVDL